ncbi:hypothetical protein KUTeg_009111 [Tegillarca granosa]|uniref:C-type lectin domain-containing protein n=1 Tax=Tegillarca granosa TaxID=220873 RepID=A0ABQ9F7I1_TEGGR|nr:hypothetical protein KUTeg_009111 [Tegillarca granosa]
MGSIVGIAVVNSVCPEDWVEYQDTCLLFSKDAQSWDAAEGHCRLFGKAYLAAVETAEKMKFIENILRVLHLHWLGARDFIIEGSWRWLKTGFGLTYFNWGPNEPDDINGSQNCLKVLAFNETIAWGDASCRDRHYYICEQA